MLVRGAAEVGGRGDAAPFDTGAWSLYALGGGEATLHYHTYVVSCSTASPSSTNAHAVADYATLFDDVL